MPDAPAYEQLVALVAELSGQVAELSERNTALSERNRVLAERVAELERLLSADSSNSSRPPSSDAPWEKKPANKRSARIRSGRKPGKQPGASSLSRTLVDNPDRVVVIEPERCLGCEKSLTEGAESGRERRQVVDVRPVPAPEVTEYQRVSKVCSGCGTVTTPGWDTGQDHAEVVSAPGSPVRLGPEIAARVALLTCGHFLPVGRARTLLEALCGMGVSIGFVAGIRGRAARKLEKKFRAHLQELLANAPVLPRR